MYFYKVSPQLKLQSETIQEDQLQYIKSISTQYEKGYLLLNSIGQISATFYGGSRVLSGSDDYMLAYDIASYLSDQSISIISGGGPGIMEASLKAAAEKGNRAVGIGVSIEQEIPTEFASDYIMLDSFTVRKFLLRQSDLLFYFAGGVGTMDELFEVLTLIDTGKLASKKIFLCNSTFYQPLLSRLFNATVHDTKLVNDRLGEVIHYVDSVEQVVSCVSPSS